MSVNAGKGQQFVVCRLHEGKIEHCPLELPFTPEDQPMLHLKGAHTVHLTGFLEMDEEDELEEDEEMGDATATKVAPKANGKPAAAKAPAMDDDDDDDDDDEGEEEDDDDEGEEEDDDDEDDDDDEEEEEMAPPPKASGKRPIPAAAPPAKKAKAEPPKAATPKAGTPKAAKAATPAASAASPAANSWSPAEDSKLQKALAKFGESVDNRWDKIAKEVGTRNKDQCKKRLKALKSPGA